MARLERWAENGRTMELRAALARLVEAAHHFAEMHGEYIPGKLIWAQSMEDLRAAIDAAKELLK